MKKIDTSSAELIRNCTPEEWRIYIRNFPVYRTLDAATKELAARCDGAEKKDGWGFNQSDTCTGHWLARVGIAYLSPEKSLSWAKRMLKYRNQLRGYNIRYPDDLFDGITETKPKTRMCLR